jgi:CDP-diacylglycerol---serine O-phosphatidyltransferase
MIKLFKMKKYIPNALTLLNLFCGSIAVIFAVNNNFVAAALFVFLGIFFDFFDGFAARKLNVQSELGVQLDSLADMVTSGLVPGVIMYKLIYLAVESPEVTNGWGSFMQWTEIKLYPLPLIGLFITFQNSDLMNSIIINKWFLIGLTVLSCYLLNSNIKLFALKFKNWGFKENATRYIFIIMCLMFLIIWQFAAIPLIILLYIGMSVLDNITLKKV